MPPSGARMPQPQQRQQHRVKAEMHKGIALLNALDDRLEAAVRSGAIKFVSAVALLDEALIGERLPRRQDLEALERERGVRIFLTPNEAVDALRANATLTALHLTNNHIGDTGAAQLADALRANTNTALTWVALGGNPMSDEAKQAVFAILERKMR